MGKDVGVKTILEKKEVSFHLEKRKKESEHRDEVRKEKVQREE